MLLTILIYTFTVLIIGRNLSFLPTVPETKPTYNTDVLKENVLKKIPKTGNYSVYYAELNSSKSFGINEKQIHTGASLNKLPIIATLYYMAGKGKIDLNEKITIQEEDLQNYGTGSLRYTEAGQVYSLRTLARLALQQSDNTAAKIIANKIGMNNIQFLINVLGLSQTNMENNETSVYDMFLLLKKIYYKELVKEGLTKEILGFLKDTDIENRLSDQLPKEANVYHKTGDAVGSVHDVGLIEYKDKIYFLGVMTSDIGGKEKETEKTISQISKSVFEGQ